MTIERAMTVIAAGILATVAVPAAAQAPGFTTGDNRADDDGIVEVDFTTTERLINDTIDAWTGEPSPNVIIGLARIGFDVGDHNNGLCMAFEWASVPREDADRLRTEALDEWESWPFVQERVAAGADPTYRCPVDPVSALPPELVEAQVVSTLRDQLPRPQLELPPGFALTGLRTYLITGHSLEHQPEPFTLDLGLADIGVEVTATGTSVVDWGDGTSTSYDHGATEGWPDGPINHVYTDAGLVDITVTDTWDLTYTAGPFTGEINGLELQAVTLDDVEVQERRAVRTR